MRRVPPIEKPGRLVGSIIATTLIATRQPGASINRPAIAPPTAPRASRVENSGVTFQAKLDAANSVASISATGPSGTAVSVRRIGTCHGQYSESAHWIHRQPLFSE